MAKQVSIKIAYVLTTMTLTMTCKNYTHLNAMLTVRSGIEALLQ